MAEHVPPATPIRFGIADLWLLSGLIAAHVFSLLNLLNIGATDYDGTTRIAAAATLCSVFVGCAWYLAHRLSTVWRINSLFERAVLVVFCEIMLGGLLFTFIPIMIFSAVVIFGFAPLLLPLIILAGVLAVLFRWVLGQDALQPGRPHER